MDTKASLLIIDDDEGTRRTLTLILNGKGFRVRTAETGREGLEKARESPVDVILLDIKLPDAEGVELVRPLSAAQPDVAVILITAYASVETAVTALRSGVSAYLIKPVNVDEALTVIGQVLEKRRLIVEKREVEQRFRDIAESMADWIWEMDENRAYTYCSGRVRDVLGYTPEEMIGKTPFDFMPSDEADRVRGVFSDIVAKKEPIRDVENWNLAKDGTPVCLLTNGVPLLDRQSRLRGYRGVDKAVTERKRAEEAHERLACELKRKNKELESVLYIASHDMWSALVNIKGFSGELDQACGSVSSLVAEAQLPADQKKQLSNILKDVVPRALEFIVASVDKMDTLLDGLLRLSRLGRAVIQLKQLDMNATLAEIAKSFEFRVRESEAALEIDTLPSCFGDETQINQVFSNLLDNALKYLDPARPGLIRVHGQEEGAQTIYCVEDNGIGIAPEDQRRVFDAFHRVNPEGPIVGEGLGLAMVRRILDRHQGKAWLESKVGEGSRFFVSLPLGDYYSRLVFPQS